MLDGLFTQQCRALCEAGNQAEAARDRLLISQVPPNIVCDAFCIYYTVSFAARLPKEVLFANMDVKLTN